MESSVPLLSRSPSFPPSSIFFLPRHISSPSPSPSPSPSLHTSISISISISARLSPTDLERPSSPSPSPLSSPSSSSSSSSSLMKKKKKSTGMPCEPLQSSTHLRPSSRRPSIPIETCAYASTAGTDPYILQAHTAEQMRMKMKMKMNKKTTHYAILGVTPMATPKEIRAAYRQMALRYHPDVSPLHLLDMATQLFADINEAYSTLSDPQKRADYDRSIAQQDLLSPPLGSPSAVAPSAMSVSSSPRPYTHLATGRIYPSMNSFYREWRRGGAQN